MAKRAADRNRTNASPEAPDENIRAQAKLLSRIACRAIARAGRLSLSEEETEALGPVIGNAICTGLHALQHYETSEHCRYFLQVQSRLIPEHCAEPELLPDYQELCTQQVASLRSAMRKLGIG